MYFLKGPTTFEIMKSGTEDWRERDLLSILLTYVQPLAAREKSEGGLCVQYVNKFILP